MLTSLASFYLNFCPKKPADFKIFFAKKDVIIIIISKWDKQWWIGPVRQVFPPWPYGYIFMFVCLLFTQLLLEQVHVVETMTPFDFSAFRGYLGGSSGFESHQFRILENKLGIDPVSNRDIHFFHLFTMNCSWGCSYICFKVLPPRSCLNILLCSRVMASLKFFE